MNNTTPKLAEIEPWAKSSTKLLVKRLSRNDVSWATDRGKHQSGFYIPKTAQRGGFFPPTKTINPLKPHIKTAHLITLWISSGEIKDSRIKRYTNKGSEAHFTRIPRDQFENLNPSSLLLVGKLSAPSEGATHWFATIDSSTSEHDYIEDSLELGSDFECEFFDPERLFSRSENEYQTLIKEIEKSLENDSIDDFIRSCKLLTPEKFALDAQNIYLNDHSIGALDPYRIESPGDAVMKISRDIEHKLYRSYELRSRSAEVIKALSGVKKMGGITDAVVRNFAELDRIFLSASQTRKSRAGQSFEHHISRLLIDGGIAHEKQVVTGGRRPDFVLPSLRMLAKKTSIILSAKTTLRERWKQVRLESHLQSNLFLATVDGKISTQAIQDMHLAKITLVVPESLVNSPHTYYNKQPNVISFRSFFDSPQVLSHKS